MHTSTILHLAVVAVAISLILAKVGMNLKTYVVIFSVLSFQLFSLIPWNQVEFFQDGEILKTLDMTGISRLYSIPGKVKNHIVPGIQTLIDSSKSQETIAMVYPKDYDTATMIDYKQIDYMLEKIKVFSEDIYHSLIPQSDKISPDKENIPNVE
jgi:hypothetical protein